MLIGAIHRTQQSGGLSREFLAATQQLTDWRTGRWGQGLALLCVESSPLGFVAGLEKRAGT
jgi:hypothetical protein